MPTTYAYLAEDGTPWLRVLNGVDDGLVEQYAGTEHAVAFTVTNQECVEHPTATIWFAERLDLTDTQAHAVAHEMSHLIAKLLKREDTTHDVDGGHL